MRMREGYARLWRWFGMSKASWLVLPRSMMHEMPDEWQDRMAELMEEWDETWERLPEPTITARKGGKFAKWPSWLLNYRHPNKEAISSLRHIKIDS